MAIGIRGFIYKPPTRVAGRSIATATNDFRHAVTENVMADAINLAKKLASFADHWSPRVIGAFNGHDVMVAKLKGEFVWHAHADTDDFFLVLKGRLKIETEEGDVLLNEGELYVVPRGIRHRPVADEEVEVLLLETAGEPNSGDSTEREPATKRRI